MTCKDCIHYDVCQTLWEGNGISKVPPSQCGCFKDKSLFVELPVKVGQTVYRICGTPTRPFIKEKEVMQIGINRNGFTICTDGAWDDVLERKVFLTREEAEKALKEKQQ